MNAEEWSEIKLLCSDAKGLEEGNLQYIFLPSLKLPVRQNSVVRDALLCLGAREGYTTRLFLSERVDAPVNWQGPISVFGRAWHTWSWNNVPSTLRPAEILVGHLRALR